MEANLEQFKSLLDYEINQSTRHCRYLSLVMLSFENGCGKPIDLLRSGLRRSDAVSLSENTFIVLMGETARSEAIRAINRYGDTLEGRLRMRCSISSFPDDGKTSEELFVVLRRRLKTASEFSHGAIAARKCIPLLEITQLQTSLGG